MIVFSKETTTELWITWITTVRTKSNQSSLIYAPSTTLVPLLWCNISQQVNSRNPVWKQYTLLIVRLVYDPALSNDQDLKVALLLRGLNNTHESWLKIAIFILYHLWAAKWSSTCTAVNWTPVEWKTIVSCRARRESFLLFCPVDCGFM